MPWLLWGQADEAFYWASSSSGIPPVHVCTIQASGGEYWETALKGGICLHSHAGFRISLLFHKVDDACVTNHGNYTGKCQA